MLFRIVSRIRNRSYICTCIYLHGKWCAMNMHLFHAVVSLWTAPRKSAASSSTTAPMRFAEREPADLQTFPKSLFVALAAQVPVASMAGQRLRSCGWYPHQWSSPVARRASRVFGVVAIALLLLFGLASWSASFSHALKSRPQRRVGWLPG